MEASFSPLDYYGPRWICLAACLLGARLLAENATPLNYARDYVLVKFKAEIVSELSANAANPLQIRQF